METNGIAPAGHGLSVFAHMLTIILAISVFRVLDSLTHGGVCVRVCTFLSHQFEFVFDEVMVLLYV